MRADGREQQTLDLDEMCDQVTVHALRGHGVVVVALPTQC